MKSRIPKTLAEWKQVLLNNPQIRIRVTLYFGLLVNFIYAGIKLVNGIQYQSIWFVAVSVFYAVLSLMRFILVKSVRGNMHKESKSQYIHGLRSYRFCGYLMFLLNVAMCGIVMQMVWKNESYYYPGYIIYLSAAYAFTCLVSAIISVFRYRDMRAPELSAAKLLSLAKSGMSLLAMQTAMLMQFGDDFAFRQMMNSISGGLVCSMVFCMAIYMIARSRKEFQMLNEQGE